MRILAVDDDPIILELLRQFVASFGDNQIETAESGPAALALIDGAGSGGFDCFLFDIQMPQMDGVELTRRIRNDERHADTPVLMLTAMSDKRYVDSAFAAGATDYISKPFEVADLNERLTMVEDLIATRKAHTRKIFATTKLKSTEPAERLELFEPISIHDVENVIEYTALENYVTQLSRSALFGSSAFAFTIRKIHEFHGSLSAFEFFSLVTDVAELISDTLADHQMLMAYAGNGTFVCVTESGWRPDPPILMDAINLTLAKTELFDNAGRRLEPRVSAGQAVRMIWKSGAAVLDAVASAHTTAEDASMAHERSLTDFWAVERRA